MRWLFLIVSGVLIGLVLHIVSLLAVPTLAPRDAYSRLAAFTGVNEAAALDVADAEKSLPFLDPAFAYMACRFDVSSGPLQIRVPLAGRYVAVYSVDEEALLVRVLLVTEGHRNWHRLLDDLR